MLAAFNPNSNVISRQVKQMASWKTLINKQYDEYLKVVPSKIYDAPNGGKGCTLAVQHKNGDIFTAWAFGEVAYSHVNGDFKPLNQGKYASSGVNDADAKRTIDIKIGDVSERLKSHLLEAGWSESGCEKFIKDQMKWKTWFEGILDYASVSAASMVTGDKRKETKAFLKNNNVTDGAFSTLFKHTKQKDDVNTVKLVKIKRRELKEIEDNVFMITAKSRLMQYGKPAYPIILDNRDRDMEPVSLVPSDELISKIYKKNADGEFTYCQFDEETGEELDKTLIRSGDLVKMCFRPKFYKSSDTIGFTMELKEIILIERPVVHKKQRTKSAYSSADTQAELNEYF